MPIKYKKLRLEALSVAPTSFSSSYEIKSSLPDNEWVNPLPENKRETFICAARPTQDNLSDSQIPEQSIWVGQLTLRGLQRLEAFILPEESCQKKPGEEDQGLWQMLTLVTLPNHRGRGLGKRLCQDALNYLASYQASPRELWVRLMAKPENHATVSLYLGPELVEAGKCTLAGALVANGGKDLPTEYIGGEKYASRSGLIMMLESCRSSVIC